MEEKERINNVKKTWLKRIWNVLYTTTHILNILSE
jgi:hypothetical protein